MLPRSNKLSFVIHIIAQPLIKKSIRGSPIDLLFNRFPIAVSGRQFSFFGQYLLPLVQALRPARPLAQLPDGLAQVRLELLGRRDFRVPRQHVNPLVLHVFPAGLADARLSGSHIFPVDLFHVFGVSFPPMVLENVFPDLGRRKYQSKYISS